MEIETSIETTDIEIVKTSLNFERVSEGDLYAHRKYNFR